LLALPDDADDVAIAAAAATRRIGVQPLSPLHLAPSRERGLVIGYGRLPDSRIDDAVRALTAVLRAAGIRGWQR
jgi:GntR family transcriptional regulator/MocR family aminotransferase